NRPQGVGLGIGDAVGVGVGVAGTVGVGVAVGVGVGVGAPLTRSYPITSITLMSTGVISFSALELLNALNASFAPLAQSCGSAPLTELNAFSSVVPASIEKNLPGAVFRPRLLAAV